MSEKPAKAQRACLIFNPGAGSARGKEDRHALEKRLGEQFALEWQETSEDCGADTLARQALADGHRIILAAGGDGTIAAVAEQLLDSDCTLGIIPRGTANALAVCLYGTAVRGDLLGVSTKHILAGTTRTIDAVTCGERHMFLLAGVGLERGMVERAERNKDQLGVLAYLAGGWEEIHAQEEFTVRLQTPEGPQEFCTSNLVVANAAPLTSIFAHGHGPPQFDDGLLDITALREMENPAQVAGALLDLVKSGVTGGETGPGIFHLRTKEVTVEADPPQKLVLDGEIVGKTPVTFTVRPGALRVFGNPSA
jgi:diacylglycerol kinase family enzyme